MDRIKTAYGDLSVRQVLLKMLTYLMYAPLFRCAFPADRNTISGFFNNVLPVRQHLPATRLSKIGFGELCPCGSTFLPLDSLKIGFGKFCPYGSTLKG